MRYALLCIDVFSQKCEMLWEGDQVDCYGRCLDLLREHGVEVWMRDREAPGFHCRLEDLREFPLPLHRYF